MALLPKAVAAGIAYVPGAAFYAHRARSAHAAAVVRDAVAAKIADGVALLGGVLREHLALQAEVTP